MPEFPSIPVSPAELLEDYLPAALAEVDPPEAARAVDLQLGVRLEGAGGGEWVVEARGGRFRVRSGSRADAAFSFVQSVDDWRGALWEGRGGAVGQALSGIFRPNSGEARAVAARGAPAIPALLQALARASGLLRVVLTHDDGDWRIDLKLGPGEIPPEPSPTLSLRQDDADQFASGEFQPLEAFMAGRIRVTGDMGLVLQVQAAQIQAAQAIADARRSG